MSEETESLKAVEVEMEDARVIKKVIPHVFLGGYCKSNEWREHVIKESPDSIKFFDPYREDWDLSCWGIEREFLQSPKWRKVYYIRPDQGLMSVSEILRYGNEEWTVFAEKTAVDSYSWTAVLAMIKDVVGGSNVNTIGESVDPIAVFMRCIA